MLGAMSPSRTLDSDVRTRLLDPAERLFYGRGVQAVGIDAVVTKAGVATKTLYTCFGSKVRACGDLPAAPRPALARLAARCRGRRETGAAQVLAVFDALGSWFAEPGFNGCAFINVAGELATRHTARAIARDHKRGLRAQLADVAQGCGVADPTALAERLMLLVEGAIVTAHIEGNAAAAAQARLGRSGTARSRQADRCAQLGRSRTRPEQWGPVVDPEIMRTRPHTTALACGVGVRVLVSATPARPAGQRRCSYRLTEPASREPSGQDPPAVAKGARIADEAE